MPNHIRRLIAQTIWADRRIVQALSQDHRCAADADILRTLAHVAAVEHLWLSRIRGERQRVAVWPALIFEEIGALFEECHDELAGVSAALTPEALARDVDYVNSKSEPWRSTVADMLTQLATHGHYHRGQVVRAIRRVGGVPPSTDYIVWARTGGA